MDLKLPDLEVLMDLHEIVLMVSGGKEGVHDQDRLDAAIQRPQTYIQYVDEYDIDTICALLIDSIARGHGFKDGNKRTALLTALYIYRINGIHFEATQNMNDAFDDLTMWVVLQKPTTEQTTARLKELKSEFETKPMPLAGFMNIIQNLRRGG